MAIANIGMNPEVIDRELRRIAADEAHLLHEKSQLLVHAVRTRVWAAFGRGSLLEYLEEIFGYTPKVARDHVRVAFAMEEMPALGEMLETGEQSYTALRELARVATPDTVEEWREAARGMNVRQVEELVTARAKGDRPTDPRNPDLATRKVTFELRPSTRARLRQARQILAAEHDEFLDDDTFVEALCTAVLDGSQADEGRARHQLMMTVCEECGAGWQDAAGHVIAIDAVDVERAECDAQRMNAAGRATQDVMPTVRRLVWRRDHGKCRVPACRAARNIDLHHIVHRAEGGGHEAENLLLLCGGHHRALHEGTLLIAGTSSSLSVSYPAPTTPHVGLPRSPAPHVEAFPTPPEATVVAMQRPTSFTPDTDAIAHAALRHSRPEERRGKPWTASSGSAVTPSRFATVVVETEAKRALKQLGFKKDEAARYVAEALAVEAGVPTLEAVIRSALQRSRRSA